MTDYFAALDEPRRPWLEADSLKQRFLALSADVHPDHVHGAGKSEKAAATQRYAELNAAYNCLRDPKERLAHLLELELGHRPADVQTIPADLADSFMAVASLCREVDGFLIEKNRITSPLLQVQSFERSQQWNEKLGALQHRLNHQRETLAGLLKAVDTTWVAEAGPAAHKTMLGCLEELYRLLSYFARWDSQIRERIVQLSL